MALRSRRLTRRSVALLPVAAAAALVLAGAGAATAAAAGPAVTTTSSPRTTTCNPTGGGFLAATTITLSFTLNGCLPSSGVGRVNVYGSAAGGTPVGSAEATVPAGTVTVSGLVPGTQYWYDLADGLIRGPVSTLAVTTSTSTTPAPSGCVVDYAVTGQWPGAFQASLILTNASAVNLDGWVLTFSFPDGQRVQQGWAGTYGQTGAEVTVAAPDWARTLRPQQSARLGFIASWSGRNGAPASFSLNGQICRPADGPTTTTTTTTTPPLTTTTAATGRCTFLLLSPDSTNSGLLGVFQLTATGSFLSATTMNWTFRGDEQLVSVQGATGFSQTGKVASLSGLTWTPAGASQVYFRIASTNYTGTPTDVRVGGRPCLPPAG